jgi:hypothetical protein
MKGRKMKKCAMLLAVSLAFAGGCQESERIVNQQELVEYRNYAATQHQDSNLIYARILGYLDARYSCKEKNLPPSMAFGLLVSDSNAAAAIRTPEDALFWLNECYKNNSSINSCYKTSDSSPTKERQRRQNILTPNAYGSSPHINQYGQPVTLRPDFGGVPGEQLQIRPNTYGPGVHSDQYGRPVREYPWP